MQVEDVKELTPTERFLYWIVERHQIYLRRKAGQEKPWTDDEILQSYFFTNPYRENDKVTVWFKENIRSQLYFDPDVLFATVAFRWFNLPYTGEQLLKYPSKKPGNKYGAFKDWDEAAVVSRLESLRDHGANIFTGAYIVKCESGAKGSKIPSICRYITNVWKDRVGLTDYCISSKSLQLLHTELMKFPYMGKFTAYEVVSDLRHTYLLCDASDIMTWANPGPGAIRGLMRIEGREPGTTPEGKVRRGVGVKDPVGKMRSLLDVCHRKLPSSMPKFEMREVEHSLCEFDKYERALWGGAGRMKRRYNGHS